MQQLYVTFGNNIVTSTQCDTDDKKSPPPTSPLIFLYYFHITNTLYDSVSL